MADFSAVVITEIEREPYPGRVEAAHTHSPPGPAPLVDSPSVLDPASYPQAPGYTEDSPAPAVNTWNAYVGDKLTPSNDFFETVHVVPRSLRLGNVLVETSTDLEVYSAFRRDSIGWTAFTNNAGDGVSVSGLPSLTYSFPPQSGVDLTVTVDPDGPATVNSTLDFLFDVPLTVEVPITFDRVVLFPWRPELPYTETLEFLTDVLSLKGGKEQRFALRDAPRQIFDWNLILDDGPERSRVHNMLFGWQRNKFGVPVWHDATHLSADASAGATSLTVRNASFGEFRDGGFAVIYTDAETYEVVEIVSTTATTITLNAELATDWDAGALVAPVVTCYLLGNPSGGRFASADARLGVRFISVENIPSVGSAGAFGTYNSKLFLDDECLLTEGLMAETFLQSAEIIDSGTGLFDQFSAWVSNTRNAGLVLMSTTRQGLWQLRELVHYLRGRWKTFYVRSYSEDLTPTAGLTSGDNTLTFTHVGYTRFVDAGEGRNHINVVFNDGTASVQREVASVVEVSDTEERITLTSGWPATKALSTIDRIEFIENVRLASDRVVFEHRDSRTKMRTATQAVIE